MIHIFEISDPNFSHSRCHFQGDTTRLSHIIGENDVFPWWMLQSSLRMRSITWSMH